MEHNIPLEEFGNKIRNIRIQKGMTQIEFYNFLFPEKNLGEENIKKKMNKIEYGKGKNIDYELLFRLRERFDLSIDYLLGFETDYYNYENKAVCDYTGLNSETIRQLHFWKNTLNTEVDNKNMSSVEQCVAKQNRNEAKWIIDIVNKLFSLKSEADEKSGISDLTVLYDIYMLSCGMPKKVLAIPESDKPSDWIQSAVDSVPVYEDSVVFVDKMNETHGVNIEDIHKQIWINRLTNDLNEFTKAVCNDK